MLPINWQVRLGTDESNVASVSFLDTHDAFLIVNYPPKRLCSEHAARTATNDHDGLLFRSRDFGAGSKRLLACLQFYAIVRLESDAVTLFRCLDEDLGSAFNDLDP